MGLDMYLYCNSKELSEKVADVMYSEGSLDYQWAIQRGEIGYWRKQSQIHNWFVTNIQNGIDDCHRYNVDWEDLTDLLKVLEEVLETRNKDILPLVDGFFFNVNDDDDSWYWNGIYYTYKLIKTILYNVYIEDGECFEDETKQWRVSFFYVSSW